MKLRSISIRFIELEDAPFLLELMNSPNWLKYIGDRKICNEEDARNYILEKMSPRLEDKGFINHVMLTKESNIPVGTCSIHNREGIEGLDIGYALLPQFEGKGYARAGAKLMIEKVFNQYKQNQVSAITTKTNEASCRLLENLGFTFDSSITIPSSQEALRLYRLKK